MVFDVFVPWNKSTSSSKGFDFRLYKTEWDAKKTISFLNGRSIGGRKIMVQMANFDNRNVGGIKEAINRNVKRRGFIPV